MTKFENEALLQLLSMKAEEIKEISETEEDLNIDDGIMFQISKLADSLLEEEYLLQQNEFKKEDSIYECDGKFEFVEDDEDEW